jgi:hypothetical protein
MDGARLGTSAAPDSGTDQRARDRASGGVADHTGGTAKDKWRNGTALPAAEVTVE